MSDVPSYDDRGEGRTRKMPTLTITWDEDRQAATLQQVDISQFRTWDFIVACLEMAKSQAEFQRNMSRATAIQKQQMDEAIRQQEAERQAKEIEGITLGKH